MTPDEFGAWLVDKGPSLDAWGSHVVSTISHRVREEIGDKRYASFFKVEPKFRRKDVDSAKKKLVKKQYANPAEQMTDLVGARFVVLLRTDIQIVQNAIADYPGWTISLDRNPEFEISSDPEVFDYQSVHYLLSCPDDDAFGGTPVPAGTTCEVQVRTLLQHAYAEVVHDNVYKPGGIVPPQTRRAIARSMAFVESADELFCQALEQLEHVNTQRDEWSAFLEPLYFQIAGKDAQPDHRDNTLTLVDTFRDVLATADRRDVRAFVTDVFISKCIRRRSSEVGLFSQPICMLTYWLVSQVPRQVCKEWPFPALDAGLRQVFSDLGVAPPT